MVCRYSLAMYGASASFCALRARHVRGFSFPFCSRDTDASSADRDKQRLSLGALVCSLLYFHVRARNRHTVHLSRQRRFIWTTTRACRRACPRRKDLLESSCAYTNLSLSLLLPLSLVQKFRFFRVVSRLAVDRYGTATGPRRAYHGWKTRGVRAPRLP